MENNKIPIEVVLDDNRAGGVVAVRCSGGMWQVGEADNRWLWVLGAIAFPEEYSVRISDQRRYREDHQPDMTTNHIPSESPRTITLPKRNITLLIDAYIKELEDQDVSLEEIARRLQSMLTKTELEALGYANLINEQ